MDNHATLYPLPSAELSRKRRELAPATATAFRDFSRQVFAAGALDAKTKQLIAVAVAHVTQCPYCIRSHTAGAVKAGASGIRGDGGDLGGGRDARGRRDRALRDRAR